MGCLLAIDFGERRVGLALSDPAARFAIPYRTLERRSDRELVEALVALIATESVTGLVLGEPHNVDGSRGPAAERVRGFGAKLAAATGLEIRYVEETLTSVAAVERLKQAGYDTRRDPGRIDAVAAQILLEEALERP